jgi:hypothetical protein
MNMLATKIDRIKIPVDEKNIGFDALMTRYRKYAIARTLSRRDVGTKTACASGSDINPTMSKPPNIPKFRMISIYVSSLI